MERPDHVTSGADDPVFSALWEAHRRRMLDLAFRMLLVFRDAEDVVQE
jgi:DNA-directed RNA polymerase specialized sigma24 family protein